MRQWPIGVIVNLEKVLQEGVDGLRELGLTTCQLDCWDYTVCTPENARRVQELMGDDITITAVWAGWPGPKVWDFYNGPLTLGLVPAAYRAMRIDALQAESDFAAELGVANVTTHMGYIPEDPTVPNYAEVVIAIREVARHCQANGQWFNFETGEETPVTLIRTMEDVGLDNLGVNLDPANLLLYGRANPVDALDVYCGFRPGCLRGVHIKDGNYPTDGRHLGKETPVGQGRVDFPLLLKKMDGYGYEGALTIEREISGPQQTADIISARDLLLKIMQEG